MVKVSVIKQNALYFGFLSLDGLPRGRFLSLYVSLIAGKYSSDFKQNPPNYAVQLAVFLEPNVSSMRMKQHESVLYSLRGWMPQPSSLYHQSSQTRYSEIMQETAQRVSQYCKSTFIGQLKTDIDPLAPCFNMADKWHSGLYNFIDEAEFGTFLRDCFPTVSQALTHD